MENEDQLAGILGHEIGHATARQSDNLGLMYMEKAGYNPIGLKQSMEILQKAHKKEPSKLENLFMTHPLTTERIDTISNELNTTYQKAATRELKLEEFSKKTAHLKNLKEAYAHYDKGDEAMGKKDYKDAENEYKKAIEMHNKEAIFHSGLAFALLKQDKTEDAKAAIDASIKIEPNLFASRFLSGIINYKSEKYQASLDHMLVADKLIPDVPQVKLYIARCYERLNNREKSVAYYKETLKLDPNGDAGKEARGKLTKWGIIK